MESLLQFSKGTIFVIMGLVAFSAIGLSLRLHDLTGPLAARPARLHQAEPSPIELGDRLERIRNRYITLLHAVDMIDTAEFSAGEIETISFRFYSWDLTAASAQGWLRQAPGILISLGLLGTFLGLTIGLTQISGALGRDASPADTIAALSAIVRPMGAAFQTSLLGLFLSLLVLLWTQINGTRHCLERCESLLSSWLETVLPQQVGHQVMTPLRRSITDLNASLQQLPDTVHSAIGTAMREAFAARLDQLFDANATLAAEADAAVRRFAAAASALNESGQDFLQAAQAFRHSDFATTLQQSVQGLRETRDELMTANESLCTRLTDVRDGLLATQAEWRLLAAAAEQELSTCRGATQQIGQGVEAFREATTALQQGTAASAEAASQLRKARLEVMRDRKLVIDVARSVGDRLAADAAAAESCQAFAAALETVLSHWNRNVERLDALSRDFVAAVRNARLEDEAVLIARSREAGELIGKLQRQLRDDLGTAIDEQRDALKRLDQPTRTAQALGEQLITQLIDLKERLARLSPGEGAAGTGPDGGR